MSERLIGTFGINTYTMMKEEVLTNKSELLTKFINMVEKEIEQYTGTSKILATHFQRTSTGKYSVVLITSYVSELDRKLTILSIDQSEDFVSKNIECLILESKAFVEYGNGSKSLSINNNKYRFEMRTSNFDRVSHGFKADNLALFDKILDYFFK